MNFNEQDKLALKPAMQNGKPVYVHDYASHIPVLMDQMFYHESTIIEIGCGMYSTPLLQKGCRGGVLFQYVEDMEWANWIAGMLPYIIQKQVDFDDLDGFDKILEDRNFDRSSLVFMDFERAPKDRRPVLDVLLKHFDKVIAHDANWIPLDGLNATIYKDLHPWTAVIKSGT